MHAETYAELCDRVAETIAEWCLPENLPDEDTPPTEAALATFRRETEACRDLLPLVPRLVVSAVGDGDLYLQFGRGSACAMVVFHIHPNGRAWCNTRAGEHWQSAENLRSALTWLADQLAAERENGANPH